MKKNIVIAPCGNKSSLFNSSWLKDKTIKNFDLCLLFYHENIDYPENYENVDYFFHLKDFKYVMIANLLTKIKPEWLEQYEYFYFLDDDIAIDTQSINDMFNSSKLFKSSISQAALTHDSYCSWPMFKQVDTCFLRYVGQIEVMSPLFDRETLKKCLPTFKENLSSWGLDSVWSKLLNYAEDKMIVFDGIVMKHTVPVGGGELYAKIGVDPHDEWHAITKQYDAKLHNYREYGRLKKLHVKNDKFYNLTNFLKETKVLIARKIQDRGLMHRLKIKFK
jgi:hypothetical protein